MKFLIFCITLAFSCEQISESTTIRENEKIPTKHYSENQPNSLNEYAECMTMVSDWDIAIIRPAKTPELVKVFKIDIPVDFAQIDKNGYIWVAAAFTREDDIERKLYVLNPHTEKIHKVISLPEALRGPTSFTFGENEVYLLSRHAGRDAGLGAVDRSNYDVRILTELDSCGAHYSNGIELIDNNLFLFTQWTSQTDDRKIFQYSLKTNQIEGVSFFSGIHVKDKDYFYINGSFKTGTSSLVKMEPDKLQVREQKDYTSGNYLMVVDDTKIYMGGHDSPIIEVYSKETLEKTGEIDVSGQDISTMLHYTSDSFGFISTHLLMLNESSFYNTKTGELMANQLPLSSIMNKRVTPSENYQLKTFY